jgi:hypothetical protein
MVLILKLGRLDFLEFLSERRHDCRKLKARQRKCHKGRQSSKKNSLSVLSTAQVLLRIVVQIKWRSSLSIFYFFTGNAEPIIIFTAIDTQVLALRSLSATTGNIIAFEYI